MRKKIPLKALIITLIALVVLAIPLSIYAINAVKKGNPPPNEKYYPIDEQSEYVPDQIIVKFAPGYEPDVVYTQVSEREIYAQSTLGKALIVRQNAEYALTAQKTPEERKVTLDQLFGELGVISYSRITQDSDPALSRYYLLQLPPGSNLSSVQDQLAQSEATTAIEPDYVGGLFQLAAPNDPQYPSMWGLEMIGAPDGWQKTTGSNSVLVGVTDTGVDLNHQDLKDHIASGGRNIVENNNNPQDTHYHGTHVAGTIGAVTNNGLGVAGINWNVKLLPVKVCNPEGKCPTSSVASGISYAASNGAKVINLSVGGTPGCTAQSIYQDAVNFAVSKGTLVVVAAGNSNVDAAGISPASCNGVLTVGAVGPNKARASYSNFGAKVAISAPGGSGSSVSNGILSTLPGDKYGILAGTSMATPHVAGVAALLLSLNPSLTPQQLKDCLVNGAVPNSTDKPIGPLLSIPGALKACGFDQNTTLPPSTSPSTSPSPSPSQTAPVGASPTIEPTISLSPGKYFVGGIVYHDVNRNQRKDSGEQALSGSTVKLTGPVNRAITTGNSGEFLFRDLQTGRYTLTQSYNGRALWEYNFQISDRTPDYFFAIPVFTLSTNPLPGGTTPSPSTTPTPTNRPTSAPGNRLTPTPTPLKYYRCKTVRATPAPSGRTTTNRIGISYLKCEPITESNR